MRFIIEDGIFKKYPDLRIGAVIAKEIKNREGDPDLEELKRRIELDVRQKYSLETLVNHPFIWAWRETYRSFGVKPKKYNPTCEALIRRILQGERIPRVNVAVDSYLSAEAESLLPCGGYDLSKIRGDISLRFSNGGEKFCPIGKAEMEETNPGEVVYSDCQRILTRKWNWRDSDFTKITSETTELGLFSEAAKIEISSKALMEFVEKIKGSLSRFCGGQLNSYLVDAREKLEWNLK